MQAKSFARFAAAALTMFALCSPLASGTPAAKAASGPATQRIIVDGKTLQPASTQVVAGRLFIGVRPLADLVGATIASAHNTVTLTTLLREVIFQLGQPWAMVNGQRVSLDAAPQNVQGRILIPLRSLRSAFGASLTYRRQDHTIVVSLNPNERPNMGGNQRPPAAATTTLSGTVTAVRAQTRPAQIDISVAERSYTLTLAPGMKIEFRDVRGAVTGQGAISQVAPGDTLIATLDPYGQLISVADIFASSTGTVAAIAGQSLVLAGGRVISVSTGVGVNIDGRSASFSDLQPGDKISVRADPVSGRVRDIEAFTAVQSGSRTTGVSASGNLRIDGVSDNAERALRAGEVLRVSANGTPGAQAQFDLSNIIVANPMRETYPGRYEGEFTVGVGTNLSDAPVVVRFAKDGETAIAEAADPLTIITTPPAVRATAPAADQAIVSRRPDVFASFTTAGDKGMDPSSLHLTLNGRDVSTGATRTGTFISYFPATDLPPGTVVAEVWGTDIAGNAVRYRWSFSIR